MAIIGFNFTKILVEKKASAKGKINITNNVSIKEVDGIKLAMGQDSQEGLKFTFEFVSKYEPEVGNIMLNGEVISLETEEVSKKILDEWKANKSIEKDIMARLLNHILQKCNIQALILSKDINLPSPIPLPKVQNQN